MDKKKSPLKPIVIKSVTSVICVLSLTLTGNSIASKVCTSRSNIAAGKGASSETDIVSDEDFFAEAEAAFAQSGGEEGGGTATEGAEGTEGTEAGSDSGTGDNSAANSGASSGSSNNSSAGTKKENVISLTSGLQSSDLNEILQYYKLVAAKNEKNTYTIKMTMASLDGGSGAVGSLISAFKPIAQKALEKNSTESNDIPGIPANIKVSDWKQARAINDGTYTTLYIQVKEQTDDAYGKMDEGTVGRSITVLDGVQRAIADLPGVSADFDNGKFSLVYNNANIKVKIKNSTGEFVKGSCTWQYAVNVNMDELKVKVLAIPATLKNAKGVVNYKVTY